MYVEASDVSRSANVEMSQAPDRAGRMQNPDSQGTTADLDFSIMFLLGISLVT
jgi:hypothetical protein